MRRLSAVDVLAAFAMCLLLGASDARAVDANESLYSFNCASFGNVDIYMPIGSGAAWAAPIMAADKIVRQLETTYPALGPFALYDASSTTELQNITLYINYGEGGQTTSACYGTLVSEARATLSDISNDQGSQLALAIGLVWGVAWGIRKIADAINETDGSTTPE